MERSVGHRPAQLHTAVINLHITIKILFTIQHSMLPAQTLCTGTLQRIRSQVCGATGWSAFNRIFKAGFKHSRITVTARSIASLRTGCLKLRLVIKTAVYLQAIPPALTTSFWTLRLLMLFSEGLIPFDQMLSWVIGWSAFNRIARSVFLSTTFRERL